MFNKGSWRPGGFPPIITLVAKLTLFGIVVVRGADYFFGDTPDTARRLSTVEAAAPLHWWGLACVIAGALGFLGVMLYRTPLILWAHILGAALYSSFAMGVVVDVIRRVDDPTAGLLPAVIFSAFGMFFIVTSKGPANSQVRVGVASIMFTLASSAAALGLDGLRSVTLLVGIAALHVLMALGTAARQRQDSILKDMASE